jgi:hypothetical protein
MGIYHYEPGREIWVIIDIATGGIAHDKYFTDKEFAEQYMLDRNIDGYIEELDCGDENIPTY